MEYIISNIDYILFGIGIIIIFISLFLTYRVDSDNDEYYIESELLSKIREVKEDIEESLANKEFKEVLDEEIKPNKFNQEVTSLKRLAKDLDQKVEKIANKLDRLEGRFDNSFQKKFSTKPSQENDSVKSKEYKKIKKLVDEGYTLAEVAQKLDMGNREVRLIWKFNSRGSK
ncbi:hypothetical protein Halha_0683 [Halobacteroides halobius DSM 5150]|uniref:Uncharacterized protein n=1 Tax=Halobacteroides halobius (strain ATCC 35273 / DSM 5150 / MD-1) TaxID=748449 RepID=L0K6J9_HALHC|nr:DUF2802 domain-containing protein [Halobacteroides halobius]AGB40656.1 hypothetical protein Halha_0683 [Halobacteroides halobius DSM 5150]